MHIRTRASLFLAASALLAATLAVAASPASAIDVDSEAELRAAFADTTETIITLTADITLTCPGELNRPTGSAALTLNGGGFTITQTCAGERVIGSGVGSMGALTVIDTTITGGDKSEGNGGGIHWDGAVVLNGVTVTGNRAEDDTGALAGGVWASLDLTVDNSTISGNTAGTTGIFGALGGATSGGGTIRITDSTVSDNVAEGGSTFGGTGGAIFGNSDVHVVRSTFSGNRAEAGGANGNGGAIVINAALYVTNSTITGNVAEGAGGNNGGLAAGGNLTVAYSTVVGNSAASSANLQGLSADPSFSVDTVFATVIADPLGGGENCGESDPGVSAGYNFADDDSCALDGTGDRESAGDPLLGSLAANGGPTQTMLPAAGSPLLDEIPVASCQEDPPAGDVTTDQRGVTRPQVTGCDIGAVEVEAIPPVTTTTTGGPAGAPGTSPLVVPRFTG